MDWYKSYLAFGPRLSPGFHASPIYYYIFYPALIISHGNANSLIIFNLILATLSLGLFGYLGIKRFGTSFLLVIGMIGLFPWWSSIVLHPGNGYTYVIWLLLSLSCLWFELPLFFSALFLGLATSFHPAAIFAITLLFYEWFRRKHKFTRLLQIIFGFLLPWFPIIIFEIITKGYLFRQWYTHPKMGIFLQFQMNNLQSIVNSSYFNFPIALIILTLTLIALFSSSKRHRVWFFLTMINLSLFSIISLVPTHYLLGISCILMFVVMIILIQKLWGRWILFAMIMLYLFNTIFFTPYPTQSKRPISKIKNIVDVFVNKSKINKKNKIAVIAVLDYENKVPQADDYRFFLRMKGLDVLDVTNYSQADILIMFIEEKNFNYQKWSTWESDQFGSKKKIDETIIEGIKIITYLKKNN